MGQWATGHIPPEVLEQDLMAEIPTSEAQSIASQYMACWMSLQLNDRKSTIENCDFDAIYQAVVDSQILTSPFIESYILEGSYWFQNACNCESQICKSVPGKCQAGAPWLDNSVYSLSPQQFIPQ